MLDCICGPANIKGIERDPPVSFRISLAVGYPMGLARQNSVSTLGGRKDLRVYGHRFGDDAVQLALLEAEDFGPAFEGILQCVDNVGKRHRRELGVLSGSVIVLRPTLPQLFFPSSDAFSLGRSL